MIRMQIKEKVCVVVLALMCLVLLPSTVTAAECGGVTIVSQLNLNHGVSVFILDGLGQVDTICQLHPVITIYYHHLCKCVNGGSGFGGCWHDSHPSTVYQHNWGTWDPGCEFRDGVLGYQACRCTQNGSVCCD